MNLTELSTKMEYKERQGPGGKMLKYITARQAQDKLDAVCGPENWKVEYKDIAGNLFAGVSIRIVTDKLPSGDVYEWITKWDAGSESNIEKEKGHISDSFKRACVCWGIGRFLYGELPGDDTVQDKEVSKTVKPKYFNYEDLLETVEAGNTTGEQIKTIIKEDNFTCSKFAGNAIAYYLETGEVRKDLFYAPKN